MIDFSTFAHTQTHPHIYTHKRGVTTDSEYEIERLVYYVMLMQYVNYVAWANLQHYMVTYTIDVQLR